MPSARPMAEMAAHYHRLCITGRDVVGQAKPFWRFAARGEASRFILGKSMITVWDAPRPQWMQWAASQHRPETAIPSGGSATVMRLRSRAVSPQKMLTRGMKRHVAEDRYTRPRWEGRDDQTHRGRDSTDPIRRELLEVKGMTSLGAHEDISRFSASVASLAKTTRLWRLIARCGTPEVASGAGRDLQATSDWLTRSAIAPRTSRLPRAIRLIALLWATRYLSLLFATLHLARSIQ